MLRTIGEVGSPWANNAQGSLTGKADSPSLSLNREKDRRQKTCECSDLFRVTRISRQLIVRQERRGHLKGYEEVEDLIVS